MSNSGLRKSRKRSTGEQLEEYNKKTRRRRKRRAFRAKKPERNIDHLLFHTGSVILNLCMSDSPAGGFKIGKVENLIGDSSSGKTFVALSTLAEACHDPRFNDYRLIYDDVEEANEFDVGTLFGSLIDRIESPSYDENDKPVFSDTIQDFHDHILDALDKKEPFIYILDSLDAADAEEDQKKVQEQRADRKKGKKTKGTYGMAKPKAVSWILKNLKGKLKKHKSTLIIISQTRDNIDPMSFIKKTRAGGKALKFYSCHELWMAIIKHEKKRERVYGVKTKIKCSKNKITGKVRDCEFTIFYDYGIDDIGSMIDFLVKEEHWKKVKASIVPHDLKLVKSGRDKLINQIENSPESLKQLPLICKQVWDEIEDSLKTKRKKKYS